MKQIIERKIKFICNKYEEKIVGSFFYDMKKLCTWRCIKWFSI